LFCSPCPEVKPSKKIHKTKGFDCKKTKKNQKLLKCKIIKKHGGEEYRFER
jgi:hypothetical protein